MRKNVFLGPDGHRNFLKPENYAPPPLVELTDPALNKYREYKVRLVAKCSYLMPLLNIKALPAYEMLAEAKERGDLEGVAKIIEAGSGNTGGSLAILARALFGISETQAIVPSDIAPFKDIFLQLVGAQPQRYTEPIVPGPKSSIEVAKQRGKEPGCYNPGQYFNEANIRSHQEHTARQIWEETEGKVTLVGIAMGTVGTALGCARGFASVGSGAVVVGGVCAPDNAVPGARTFKRIDGENIGFGYRDEIEHFVEVMTKDSFRASLALCRSGILAGPSSGLAKVAEEIFIERMIKEGRLDEFRNEDGDVFAVFICPDTPYPYLDKYSTHLDSHEI